MPSTHLSLHYSVIFSNQAPPQWKKTLQEEWVEVMNQSGIKHDAQYLW
ncbi:MAG: hypothetical protein HYR55_00425 [Acidobacteria bacterium]|nr:hypothetical protein [Acidobacteriota bacterium]MBI3655111.1 hypothetical protein [Acidobacteriota bacterium]